MSQKKKEKTANPNIETIDDEIIETIDDEMLTVVGIGASAGGLEALSLFVKNLKKTPGVCYIIAQHLSPTYKSMMVNLLSKESRLQILEAAHKQPLQENTIYICPPNNNITLSTSDCIILSEPESARYGPKPSIDLLFESIAAIKGSKGIGIILSGTGSDGARGIRFIKAEAGFTFVQDPATAKYDGMPNAAIGTSKVDFVLKAEEISQELLDILIYPNHVKPVATRDDRDQAIYKLIFTKLRDATKVDFSKYKSNTIHRRIDRRMAALKIATLRDYNNFLQKTPSEADLLYKNILIGVTEFFRDDRPFELVREALESRIAKKTERIVRVWAPGASTGEEAYTLAIILHELLKDRITDWKIQIFATDIDEDALSLARKGSYSESALLVLNKEQRDQYFRLSGDVYSVTKTIRDMVIFSKHDLTVDPPFLNLDLIVCRNLLIYFNNELQQRIFPAFHYALGHEGILLLGKSESIGQFSNYFSTRDNKWRLYQANFLGERKPSLRELPAFQTQNITSSRVRELTSATRPNTLRDLFVNKVHQFILPMCLLVNEVQDIIYSGGKNPYISRPEGAPNDNLFKNIHPGLSTELRVAYQKAHQDQVVVKSKYLKIEVFAGEHRYVRVVVVPMEISPDIEKSASLVCFQEESADEPLLAVGQISNITESDQVVKQLEVELLRTQNQLQTLVEELETSNEELQSMNEELQSTNEELQSTNEELETTNEELQSTNEELQTAYSELRMSYSDQEKHAQELEVAQEDLNKINEQFLRGQNVAKLGHFEWDIENDHHVWSPYLFAIFDFNPLANQPKMSMIKQRVHPKDLQKLEKAIEESLSSGAFDLQYRLIMNDQSIKYVHGIGEIVEYTDGKAVLMTGTAQDVTLRVEAELKSSSQAQNLDVLMELAPVGIYLFNLETGLNTFVNDAYTELTGYTLDDLSAMTNDEFMGLFQEDEKPKIQKHMNEVANSEIGKIHRVDYQFRHKNGIWLQLRSCDAAFSINADSKLTGLMGSFVVLNSPEEN